MGSICMATPSLNSSSKREVLNKLVEDQLTCAVCLEHYTDPRALPCQHAFCKKCIDRLRPAAEVERRYQRGNEVKCPKCRKLCQLGLDLAALPTAYHINNLLDIDALLKKEEIESHPECSEHEKPRDVFCETCEELICYICSYAEKHHDHKRDLADTVFERNKREIGECLQPLKEKIVEVEQMLIIFDQTKEQIEKQGEAVKNEIQLTVQLHMNRLADLMNALQQSKDLLFDQAEAATNQKLHLHMLQKEGLETILVHLISCKEFVEKRLETKNQCLTQSAKTGMAWHINEAHSKASELHPPSQSADTAFVQNYSALSEYTLPELGNVKSTLRYRSVPGLFSVDLPLCAARKITEISLTASVPTLSEKSLHCSLNLGDKFSSNCKVAQVDKERFTVMLSPEQPGQHILSVSYNGEHEGDVHSSVFEVPVISIVEWRESRLEVFADSLRHPRGVAVTDDGKYVIVTESQRDCVTVFFAENGEVVKRFGKHGSRPGELENPKEVAVSTDGYIYVMDNNQIQEFTPSGLHKSSLSKSSRQIGYGMAFLSQDEGLLTCSTREKMAIHKIDPALNKFEFFGHIPSGEPYDIAVDTKGLIYVLTSTKGIHKFTPEGEHICSFGSKGTQYKPLSFELCIDAGNTIYVTEGPKVKMFTTDGDFLGIFDKNHPKLRGIAVSKSTGDLYMCKASGEVLVSRN